MFYSTAAPSHSNQEVTQTWVTYEDNMSYLPQARWIESQSREQNDQVSNLRCNDAESLIIALRNGFGKTLLPRLVASALSDLKEISGYDDLPKREVWSLIHPNVADTRKTRVVLNWLKTLFATRDG